MFLAKKSSERSLHSGPCSRDSSADLSEERGVFGRFEKFLKKVS